MAPLICSPLSTNRLSAIQCDIVKLEQIAAEQTLSTDEVLEAAARAYLREIDRKKIKAESTAFAVLHETLVKTHFDQYVAVHHGQVVDYDADFQAIHARIRQRFGRQAVLVRRVEARVEHELMFRSPRLERSVS